MKTSNKLLIIAFAIILTGTVLVILKVKQFMVGEQIELSGTTTEKVYEVFDIKEINVAGAFEIKIIKSDISKLTLEADSSILSNVIVEQTGNSLAIKLKSMWGIHTKVKGTLQVKDFDIRNMELSAGAEIKSYDTLTTAQLTINVSAGAHADLPVSCDYLDCNASAGAGAKLSGQAKEFKTNASAGAHIKAGELIAEDAIADASAGGFILLNVSKNLDVSCSAGGSVKYFGNPAMKNIDINSGGNLSKAN